MIAELIQKHLGKIYHPHYVAELLHNLGHSYQKACFEAERSPEVEQKRSKWETETWPNLLATAAAQQVMLLFGDEASFAQWGSLSYTWAKRGEQPLVKTCGKRKAYKVFGLIDYFSGPFSTIRLPKANSPVSHQDFLTDLLNNTTKHIFLIQDGARYHTSAAMQAFFAAHKDRLTVFDLPPYSSDFNPVDDKLTQFARLLNDILALMGKYCRSLTLDNSSSIAPPRSFAENVADQVAVFA